MSHSDKYGVTTLATCENGSGEKEVGGKRGDQGQGAPACPSTFYLTFCLPAELRVPGSQWATPCHQSLLLLCFMPGTHPTSACLGRASPAPHGTPIRALTASIGVTDVLVCSSKLGSPAGRGPVQVLGQPRELHTMPGRAGPCRMWSPSLPIQIWVPERPDGRPHIMSPLSEQPRKLLLIPSLAFFPADQTAHMFGNKWRP